MVSKKDVGFWDYLKTAYGAGRGLQGMYENRGDFSAFGELAGEMVGRLLPNSVPRLQSRPQGNRPNFDPVLRPYVGRQNGSAPRIAAAAWEELSDAAQRSILQGEHRIPNSNRYNMNSLVRRFGDALYR